LFTPFEYSKLFKQSNNLNQQMDELKKAGGIDGVVRKLASDKDVSTMPLVSIKIALPYFDRVCISVFG
jgi:hypothetical protein